MVGGLGVWGGWGVRETEKGTTVLCSVKISFHIFQIKRAAALIPLQHFKKECKKHMAERERERERSTVFLCIICTVQPLRSFWTGSDNTGECLSGQRASILGS